MSNEEVPVTYNAVAWLRSPHELADYATGELNQTRPIKREWEAGVHIPKAGWQIHGTVLTDRNRLVPCFCVALGAKSQGWALFATENASDEYTDVPGFLRSTAHDAKCWVVTSYDEYNRPSTTTGDHYRGVLQKFLPTQETWMVP